MVADLTRDEAIDRARAIEVESYDIFLDLAAEPVLSRTEVRFRWLRPHASTFAELRTHGVRGVTLDGVSLPPPDDGRLRLGRTGDDDLAVLVAEAEAGYSQEGRGLSRFTDLEDGASYVMAMANLGVPCPYPAYDIVFMPDLAALALSVPGLMVVNERLLGRSDGGGDRGVAARADRLPDRVRLPQRDAG
jgi:aminopeptidase N